MFNKLLKFRKNQEGNATIEFVFLFPVFIFLFLTGFESGYYMVRNVMLERAVDVVVREVRLSNGAVPEFDTLKQRLCQEATILPDCTNSLQIEMRRVPMQVNGIAVAQGPARCVDKQSNEDQLTGTVYETGQQNQLMFIRVCALSQPLFPTTGIGVGMRRDADGNYAIVATTAFVTEPGDRSVQVAANGGVNP